MKILFTGLLVLGFISSASAAEKIPCGLEGTTENRIMDCGLHQSSQNGNFILVTRTEDFKEVYQDKETGLFWGDRYFYTESGCGNRTNQEVGKIKDVQWRVPTIAEFAQASINGIMSELPNMDGIFLSSSKYWTIVPRGERDAGQYVGTNDVWFFENGRTFTAYPGYTRASLRCVGYNKQDFKTLDCTTPQQKISIKKVIGNKLNINISKIIRNGTKEVILAQDVTTPFVVEGDSLKARFEAIGKTSLGTRKERSILLFISQNVTGVFSVNYFDSSSDRHIKCNMTR